MEHTRQWGSGVLTVGTAGPRSGWPGWCHVLFRVHTQEYGKNLRNLDTRHERWVFPPVCSRRTRKGYAHVRVLATASAFTPHWPLNVCRSEGPEGATQVDPTPGLTYPDTQAD